MHQFKKFHPLTKGKHPEYSLDEVKEELVLSLELSDIEKADDIVNAVCDMMMLDLTAEQPTLQVSQATTRAQEERENDAFKMIYC